jgi:uncharacterized protein YecT (DUF1311 family)
VSRNSGLNKDLVSGGLWLICVCVGLACTVAWSLSDVHASSLENCQTQMQMNQEACDDYKKVDREMNQAYQTILRDYHNNRAFIVAFRKAQLAWIRYRDAQLESIFPGDPSQYGSINTMCRCLNLAELTKERTQALNRWVEGIEEGDVCAGSARVK